MKIVEKASKGGDVVVERLTFLKAIKWILTYSIGLKCVKSSSVDIM